MVLIPKGSTLTSLARQYNTTVDELVKANMGNPSVKSRDLIMAGGELKLPSAGRSLEGTLPPETSREGTMFKEGGVPESRREIPKTTSGLNNLKEGLKLVDNYYRARQPSPQDIIAKLGAQLGEIINPDVMIGALGDYSALRRESSASKFKSAMDLISEMQTQQQDYAKNVLGKLDFILNPKEYQELISGNPSEELMGKIAESEERQEKLDTQIVTAGGRSLLINKQTGETIKDLGGAYKASGGGGTSGEIPITPTEKPLTTNQIEQFRRSYNWTPPFGYTQSKLLKYMADNPDATPEELEAGARQAIEQTNQETAQETSQETAQETASSPRDTLDGLKERVATAKQAGFDIQQIKEYIKEKYITDELFRLSKDAGFAKWYTGKEADIDRMLDNLL